MSTPRWLYAWGLGAVALGAASLLLPLYVIELGADPFLLGVLAASAAAAGTPGAFLFGRLADQTGRRRALVLGTLTAITLTLAAVPFARSIPLVIVANGIVWFSFAAVGPVLTLLVVSGGTENEWQARIARLNAVQGWGWAGGLLFGVLWTTLAEQYVRPIVAQRVLFSVCAGCTAGALAGARLYLPAEPVPRLLTADRVRRAVLRARRLNLQGASFPFTPGRVFGWSMHRLNPMALLDRFSLELIVYYGAVLLFFLGFTAFFAPLPIYLEQLGFGSGAIFWLYLVSSLGAAVYFVRAAALSQRYNDESLQSTGLLIRGLAIPAVALVGATIGASTTGLVLESILFLLVGGTWAIIAVTAATIVTRLAPEAIRGEALGAYAAVAALAGGIGSLLGGAVAEISYLLAFSVSGGFVLLSAVFVYRLRNLVEPPPPSSPSASSSGSGGATPASHRPDSDPSP